MITTDNNNHQVRLNFEEVELLDPDSTGACRTDYMHVTGGVSQVPICPISFLFSSFLHQTLPTLCGSLTGQHIIYSAIPNFPARSFTESLIICIISTSVILPVNQLLQNLNRGTFGQFWVAFLSYQVSGMITINLISGSQSWQGAKTWRHSQGSTNSQIRCFTTHQSDKIWNGNKNRKWRIQILQYECNHPAIAPEGCLQVGKVDLIIWNIYTDLNACAENSVTRKFTHTDVSTCLFYVWLINLWWFSIFWFSSLNEILIAVLHGHLWQCVQFQLEAWGQQVTIKHYTNIKV